MAKTTQKKEKGRQKKGKGVKKTSGVVKAKRPQKKSSSNGAAKLQFGEEIFTKNYLKIMLSNEVLRYWYPDKFPWISGASKINENEKPTTISKKKKPVTKVKRSQKNTQSSNDVKNGTVKNKVRKAIKKQDNEKVADTSCTTSKDAKQVQVKNQTSNPIILERGKKAKGSVGEVTDDGEFQKPKPILRNSGRKVKGSVGEVKDDSKVQKTEPILRKRGRKAKGSVGEVKDDSEVQKTEPILRNSGRKAKGSVGEVKDDSEVQKTAPILRNSGRKAKGSVGEVKDHSDVQKTEPILRKRGRKAKGSVGEVKDDSEFQKLKPILRKRGRKAKGSVGEVKDHSEIQKTEPILPKRGRKAKGSVGEVKEHSEIQKTEPILRKRGRKAKGSVGEVKDDSDVQKMKPNPKSKTEKSKPAKCKPEDGSEEKANEAIIDKSKEKTSLEDMKISKNCLKSRSNSYLSEFSWTRDISSSSTSSCVTDDTSSSSATSCVTDDTSSSSATSCVTDDTSSSSATNCVTCSENDFYCISNKTPLLTCTSIDKSDEEISCAESVMNKSVSQENFEDIAISLPPLNLSSSSSDMSVSKPHNKTLDKISELLKKFSNLQKTFELENSDWLVHSAEESNHCSDILNDRMFQNGFMKEESDIILSCRELNHILLGEANNRKLLKEKVIEENNKEKLYTGKNTNSTQAIKKQCGVNVENIHPNVSEYVTESDHDSILSLFAESLTILDSNENIPESKTGLDSNEDITETIQECTFKTPKVQSSVISPRNVVNVNEVSNIKEKLNLNDRNISKIPQTRLHLLRERLPDQPMMTATKFRSDQFAEAGPSKCQKTAPPEYSQH